MYYYLVLPTEKSYLGRELLTYSHEKKLENGQLIVVKLRTVITPAIVIKRTKKPSFHVKNIEKVLEHWTLPQTQLQLLDWITRYYPAGLGSVGSLFTPPAIPKKHETLEISDVETTIKKIALPPLTSQQAAVVKEINVSKSRTNILHGDTGSGKTRVYIELAKAAVLKNKSVLILTPEISLTPQIAEQFRNTFSSVNIVHSELNPSKRREIWLSILKNPKKPTIVIGPRSALFYPLSNLGLIVVDEFQDDAYKQDQSPRYNGVRVAASLSNITNSKLILGSATPPVEEYFYALEKGARVHRMTEKPHQKEVQNNVLIVDLSDPQELSSQPLLSKTLIKYMQLAREQKQQSLLFLNKRGSSRLVLCQNCGWSAICSRCNIPYIYHHDSHSLLCHICSNKEVVPTRCPLCSSSEILFKKPGTKAVEESTRKIFPEAKIGRYDKDNTKNETFAENQQAIATGKIDILIGTQLLTKGHDLPNLGLVGILMAEGSTQFPDYNSTEKTFQLLHQIAGRVGRHGKPGWIIAQTYDTKNTLLEYINHQQEDWIHFYNQELLQRRMYKFPPFAHLLKIEISRKTEKSAENFAQKITADLHKKINSNIDILGPSPSFFYKRNDSYFWQIIIKSKQRSLLLKVIEELPNGCTYNIDPGSLL